MNIRSVRAYAFAACAGLVAPAIIVATKGTPGATVRDPSTRIASFQPTFASFILVTILGCWSGTLSEKRGARRFRDARIAI